MSQAKATIDHATIRRWVEERDGKPATVSGTGNESGIGILRIDFPDNDPAENLDSIEWDEFFAKFDENELQFLYQDTTEGGETSRFCKFIKRPR